MSNVFRELKVLIQIEELVKQCANDADLGAAVRELLKIDDKVINLENESD